MNVKELVSDSTIAKVIATGTTTVGAATALDMIQVWLGLLGVTVGIIVGIITIRQQWALYKKTKLETKIIRQQENERLQRIESRKNEGKPLKRMDD